MPTYRWVVDTQKLASKVFYFNTSGTAQALVSTYDEQLQLGSWPVLRRTNYTWAQDATANNYISQTQAISDLGQSYAVTKQTAQTVDQYRNVTQSKLFNYGNLKTAAKTYNNTYLTGSNYTSRYIFNRLLSSTVTDGSNNTLRLARSNIRSSFVSRRPGGCCSQRRSMRRQ